MNYDPGYLLAQKVVNGWLVVASDDAFGVVEFADSEAVTSAAVGLVANLVVA